MLMNYCYFLADSFNILPSRDRTPNKFFLTRVCKDMFVHIIVVCQIYMSLSRLFSGHALTSYIIRHKMYLQSILNVLT
jgi:hypothetical protein